MLAVTPPLRAASDGPGSTALGIDVGSTNSKVTLVRIGERPRVLATASAPTPAAEALPGMLAGLIRRVSDERRTPQAVGIASMAETGVPIDEDGRPRGDWLRWDAHRSGREADDLARLLGADALFAATGVRPGPKVPLATWSWLRAHRPEVLAGRARWAGAADLVGLLLTGRLATDHTLAGRTMAYRLGAPAVVPPAFDADLLAAVGMQPEQMPDVLAPGDPVGGVTPRAAAMFGLPVGTPVAVAGHDHAVGAYAAGVRTPGSVADSIGTAEAVYTVLARDPDPAAVAAAGMSLVRTVRGDHAALLAGSPAAGAMVAWWLARQPSVPPDLWDQVRTLGDEPGEVLVLPYPFGRQSPDPDPGAPVAVIGEAASLVQTAHGVLEGLALQARWMLDEQVRLAGLDRIGGVTVLGGRTVANKTWLRLKAAATPAPVRLVRAAEPVAVGAALLGAERAGLTDGAVAGLASDPLVVPDHLHAAHDAALARFVAAARRTRPKELPV